MEDFKRIVKMKTGGSVSKAIEAYEKRERKTEVSGDIAQDKALVKKGVKQHETALHKGEPKTELTFKKGGRAKKAKGTVRKYAEGGNVSDALKSAGKSLYENVMGTPEQNKVAQESMDKQAAKGSKLAKFFGGNANEESVESKIAKKRGGKVC